MGGEGFLGCFWEDKASKIKKAPFKKKFKGGLR